MGKGKIIFIEEYRQRRCLEALLADIGLPRYCDECGDTVSAMLLAGETTDPPATTAQIVPFPTIFAEAAEEREASCRKSSRRAQARRSHRE
jgi:hypothetical protein